MQRTISEHVRLYWNVMDRSSLDHCAMFLLRELQREMALLRDLEFAEMESDPLYEEIRQGICERRKCLLIVKDQLGRSC